MPWFSRYSVSFSLVLLSAVPSSVLAAPKTCLGFSADSSADWRAKPRLHCPPASAAFAAEPGSRGGKSAENVFLALTCCPLPAADVLTQTTLSSISQCPDGFVVTGVSAAPQPKTQQAPMAETSFHIECTKINQDRYQLGESTAALSWGNSSSTWKETHRISKRDIPAALRHAVGRVSRFEWREEGCVGYPFGSLLVAKESKRCDGLIFRELQYRGKEGDPVAGTPVQTLPECSRVSDKYNPQARCIK